MDRVIGSCGDGGHFESGGVREAEDKVAVGVAGRQCAVVGHLAWTCPGLWAARVGGGYWALAPAVQLVFLGFVPERARPAQGEGSG